MAQQINVVIRFGGLTMSKKTAVQWLAEQLIPDAMRMFDAKTCNAIEEALQMEREQIQDAFYHGVDIDAFNVNNKWTEAEKYYKQNFTDNNE